jgi:hypothetical protein
MHCLHEAVKQGTVSSHRECRYPGTLILETVMISELKIIREKNQ